jgi:hypothetical protein
MNNAADHPETLQRQRDAAALAEDASWQRLHDPALGVVVRLEAYSCWRAAVDRRVALRTCCDDQNLV